MPTYEYRCQDCSHKTAVFTKSVNARVEPVCDDCGGTRLTRLISRVSFRARSRSPAEEYYSDTSNIGRGVEDSYRKFGVEMPDSVRRTIDDARRGKMPSPLDE